MQGLCAGLPLQIQRLLGGATHGVNLVKSIALNVCELDREGSVNSLNIRSTLEYLTCLIKLVQGPCALNQNTLVRDTPIVRVVSNMMMNMTNDPKLAYPSDWAEQKRLLQMLLGTLLLSTMEALPRAQVGLRSSSSLTRV